jgi:O-6-methylguanine DNA methyltransferase
MYTDFLDTPIGIIKIQATRHGIVKVMFSDEKESTLSSSLILKCKKQLTEYFLGKRKKFSLPLDIQGTNFQNLIWDETQNIDFGSFVTYKNIADSVKNPNAVRAVGNALNKNPISIIIPCHRVIREDGKSIHYSGGLKKKFWLIDHEAYIKNILD